MKNSFKLEIIQTRRKLENHELLHYRERLSHLLILGGIVSMCLEDNELYVEYNPNKFNLESFKAVLSDIGFPLKERLAFSTLHLSA